MNGEKNVIVELLGACEALEAAIAVTEAACARARLALLACRDTLPCEEVPR